MKVQIITEPAILCQIHICTRKSIFALFHLSHNISDNIKRDVLDLETASIHLFLLFSHSLKALNAIAKALDKNSEILKSNAQYFRAGSSRAGESLGYSASDEYHNKSQSK